jgi:hypothetical protein
MAAEWIKVVTNLTEKPEVLQISDSTGIDCHGVVGRLIDVWSWASRNCRNDGVTDVTALRQINKIAGCDSFADAMVSCGWITVRDRKIVFTNFDRHCSQTAKDRALVGRRVNKHRSNADVTEMKRSERYKSVTRDRLDITGQSPAVKRNLPTSC